jgi:hypothetical protein
MVMKPYRSTLDFCYLARDVEGAMELEDRLIEAAEALGIFPQGGSVEEMSLADVIPDSPLDRAMGKAS